MHRPRFLALALGVCVAATPLHAQLLLGVGALQPMSRFDPGTALGFSVDIVVRTPPIWGDYGIRTDITFDHWNGSGATRSYDQQAQVISLTRDLGGGVHAFTGVGTFVGQEKLLQPDGSLFRTRQHQTLGAQFGIGFRHAGVFLQPFIEGAVVKVFGAQPTAFTWGTVRAGITAPNFLASLLGGGN